MPARRAKRPRAFLLTLRRVPLGVWLEAEKKLGRESTGPRYLTGFHVFPTLGALTSAVRHFHNLEGRVVVTVEYGGVFPKPTKGVSVLASRMRVRHQQWRRRQPLQAFK